MGSYVTDRQDRPTPFRRSVDKGIDTLVHDDLTPQGLGPQEESADRINPLRVPWGLDESEPKALLVPYPVPLPRPRLRVGPWKVLHLIPLPRF